jgi:hypothetical protein
MSNVSVSDDVTLVWAKPCWEWTILSLQGLEAGSPLHGFPCASSWPPAHSNTPQLNGSVLCTVFLKSFAYFYQVYPSIF